MAERYRLKFKGYLDDLSKCNPAPGGGSVLCLSFCLGVGLIEKSLKYSLDKNKKLKKYLLNLKKLRSAVYLYIDLDGEIFSRILKAKGTVKTQLIKRSEKIVCDTAFSCFKVYDLTKRVELSIKRSIMSDFSIGIELVTVAFKGCILNLEANKKMFGRDTGSIQKFKKVLKQWEKF